MGWFDANTTEGDGIMLFQTKSRGGLRTVGNVLTRSTRLIGSGGVFAHNDDDESPDPTPSPIHSLDLTVDLSTSNSFDDYGLALPRTVTDYNGRIVQIPADAVPMGGLRPVRSLLQGGWAASGATVTLNSSSATAFNATWLAGSNFKSVWDANFPTTAGRTYCMSANVRVVSGTPVGVSFHHQDSPTGVKTGINPTGTVQRFSAVFLGRSGTVYMGMSTNGVLPTDLTLDVTDFMVQDITHRADLSTAPDEYVSTADDYGTGVNGFRYFDTELANTVASNVVTEGTGASIDGWLDYQPGDTNYADCTHDFSGGADTITLTATGNYTLWIEGTAQVTVAAGTATITGAGSATEGSPVTINCTATGTVTLTLDSGALDEWGAYQIIQLNDGTVPTAFIPSTGSASRPAMSPAPTISGLVGTEDARLVVTGVGPELVTNGTFDTDTTGWTPVNATLSVDAGRLKVTTTAGYGSATQTIAMTAGQSAWISFTTTNGSAQAFFFTAGATIEGNLLTATSDNPVLWCRANNPSIGVTAFFDDISIRVLDPVDTTSRIIDLNNIDGEFDMFDTVPIKVLSIDVYNDGERPA